MATSTVTSTRHEQRTNQLVYVGFVLGALAFVTSPLVFGLLAILCGTVAMVYERDGLWGLTVVAWGGFGLNAGLVLALL